MNLAAKSASKCHSQASEIELRNPPQNHTKGDLHPKLHFHNQIITEINDLEALLRIKNSEVEIRNPRVKEPRFDLRTLVTCGFCSMWISFGRVLLLAQK